MSTTENAPKTEMWWARCVFVVSVPWFYRPHVLNRWISVFKNISDYHEHFSVHNARLRCVFSHDLVKAFRCRRKTKPQTILATLWARYVIKQRALAKTKDFLKQVSSSVQSRHQIAKGKIVEWLLKTFEWFSSLSFWTASGSVITGGFKCFIGIEIYEKQEAPWSTGDKGFTGDRLVHTTTLESLTYNRVLGDFSLKPIKSPRRSKAVSIVKMKILWQFGENVYSLST